MALLTEVANFIATLGMTGLSVVDGSASATIFRGYTPMTPDLCVVVNKYGGSGPQGGFGVAMKYEMPGLQVLCRGVADDYATPDANASTIFAALGFKAATTLGSTEYLIITPVQSPFPMMKDDNQRWIIACNYLCEKAP